MDGGQLGCMAAALFSSLLIPSISFLLVSFLSTLSTSSLSTLSTYSLSTSSFLPLWNPYPSSSSPPCQLPPCKHPPSQHSFVNLNPFFPYPSPSFTPCQHTPCHPPNSFHILPPPIILANLLWSCQRSYSVVVLKQREWVISICNFFLEYFSFFAKHISWAGCRKVWIVSATSAITRNKWRRPSS